MITLDGEDVSEKAHILVVCDGDQADICVKGTPEEVGRLFDALARRLGLEAQHESH